MAIAHRFLTSLKQGLCLLVLIGGIGISAFTVAGDTAESVEIQGIENPALKSALEAELLKLHLNRDDAGREAFVKKHPLTLDTDRTDQSNSNVWIYRYQALQRSDRPESLTKEELTTIDFDHASGIYGRTACNFEEIKYLFGGLIVLPRPVNISHKVDEEFGFKVHRRGDPNELLSINCTLTDPATGYQHAESDGDDKRITMNPNAFLYAVTTTDNRITGPYSSVVGVTQYRDLIDKPWTFDGVDGCQPSQDQEAVNDIICIRDRIRLTFSATKDQDLLDAVLTEILFWVTD